MRKTVWFLVALAVLLWATAAYASPQSDLQALMSDKMMVGDGTCYVKGNDMTVEGGTPHACYAFASLTDATHIWFMVIDGEGPSHVFEGDITNGEVRLVWWRGKRDI